MLPFAYVAERFPRLVRDLTRSQNKDINFDVIGKDIELDRGVLEEITEPLIHILRNAIDHGMETPDERIKKNKPAQGNISISVLRDKDHITIAIADDGRGMDPGQLADHAVTKGILSTEKAAKLSPQEAFQLICTPGFSTAKEISNVSGRGVGMDAVNSSIHNLGGSMTIDSRKGAGSIFFLKLPISVSIIHALLVEIKGQTIAFPVNTIDRTLELQQKDIFVEGDHQVFSMKDQTLPLYNFNPAENRSLKTPLGEYIPVVVSGLDSKPFGVAVDQIIGQQEIFIKPLGRPLSHLRSCTGGAIAGDGSIIFVMDINSLR
jgi:two-component system chemotaxis sensor kinase CheA